MSEDIRIIVDNTDDENFQRTALVMSRDLESFDIIGIDSKPICRVNISVSDTISIDIGKCKIQSVKAYARGCRMFDSTINENGVVSVIIPRSEAKGVNDND